MGLPNTASSWKLQVSDSERSTSPDSSFVATGFPVAIHQPAKVCTTLRRILKFFSSCFQVSPRCSEYPRTFGCNRTFRGWGTCRNMRRPVCRCRFRFCHTYFFSLLFLHPSRHRFGAAYQAGKLSTASRAEIADVEQMKKIIPFVTCEITFGQSVCELKLGINVSILNCRIKINPLKQPIQSNSVGSWHMSHCGTSAFDYHLNHGLIVLKDVQHSTGIRILCIGWNVINVGWNDVGVLDWDGVMRVWLDNCRRVSLSWVTCSVRYGMNYVSHQIPECESGNTVHAWTCIEEK